MLYRASVLDLKERRLARGLSYRVVVMQYYPRFLAKSDIDENIHSLAPERSLFREFKAREREIGDHNLAFEEVRYEERFELRPEGHENLARLSEMAKTREVFLICQCGPLDRCHADLLLLMAKSLWGGEIQRVRLKYPTFQAKLEKEG